MAISSGRLPNRQHHDSRLRQANPPEAKAGARSHLRSQTMNELPFVPYWDPLREVLRRNYITPAARWLIGSSPDTILAQLSGSIWESALSVAVLSQISELLSGSARGGRDTAQRDRVKKCAGCEVDACSAFGRSTRRARHCCGRKSRGIPPWSFARCCSPYSSRLPAPPPKRERMLVLASIRKP